MADIVLICMFFSICINAATLALVTRELVARESKELRDWAGYDPNHFRD